jgi:hypothetical protein
MLFFSKLPTRPLHLLFSCRAASRRDVHYIAPMNHLWAAYRYFPTVSRIAQTVTPVLSVWLVALICGSIIGQVRFDPGFTVPTNHILSKVNFVQVWGDLGPTVQVTFTIFQTDWNSCL